MHPGPRAVDLRLLILSFTGGVLLVHALPHLPPLTWLLPGLAPALIRWRGQSLWAAAVFGVMLTVWRAEDVLADRWPAQQHGSDHQVQGTVASLPERKGLGERGVYRFLFEPENPALPRRIRASWYRPTETVGAGECWRFTLRLRTPHGSLNPGGFDYEGWLFRQRIGATATVRDAERCEQAQPRRVLQWRQRVVDEIRGALPGHAGTGFITALTVGDDSGFSDADWDAFRATGTSHLVAISGFNVAIVAGVVFFLLRWAWSLWPSLCLRLPAQRAALLGAALCAWAYALMAGFEPPVQRAVLMLGILAAAAWLYRFSAPSRVLALAWLVVLLADPFAVTSPGLWLSFGAVAAIFYVSLGRLRAPGAWHALIGLQLLLAVALAPLTLYFFQGASWVAPFVNLVAVPLFAVLTPWAFGAVLLYLVAPMAGLPVLAACAQALAWFRAGLDWAAQLPELWLPASPPVAALLSALLGVMLLFAPRGLPLRPLGILCLLPLLAVPVTAPRGGLEVHALDVGQGLAVAVRTPNHTLLYDAGPAFEEGFDAGESVVAPFLLSQGRRRLDVLFLSHGDNDHAGGAAAVRKLLRVGAEIGTNGAARCEQGMFWNWDGVHFEVLHPDPSAWSANNGSCVLKIEGPAFSVLLAGDIEKAAEAQLLAQRRERLRADVLIAPHHGSATSSTEQFVEAVRPELVVYGAGWRNHFRHPRPEVSARYAAVGARQHVTGHAGALSIWREDGALRVEAHRQVAARFWNAPADEPAALTAWSD